jgi:hypothetical protein
MPGDRVRAVRKGLSEAGYVEGRNVAIEFRWAAGQKGRRPELAADLVRRQVAVVATPGSTVVAIARWAVADPVRVVGCRRNQAGRVKARTSATKFAAGQVDPKATHCDDNPHYPQTG